MVLLALGLGGDASASEYGVPATAKSTEPYLLSATPRAANTVTVTAVSEKFPDIEIYVTVTDAAGNPAGGLTRDDFTVTEQSAIEPLATGQTLTCFEPLAAAESVTACLTLDISTSMNDDDRLNRAREALYQYLDMADADDRAALATFSGCDRGGLLLPAAPITADAGNNGIPDIRETADGIATVGRTAMYDGIVTAVQALDDDPFPKGVILFTDGNSNADCHHTITTAIQAAVNAGVPVHIASLDVNAGSDIETRLIRIAEETGGSCTANPDEADMRSLYDAVAGNIRNQYRLCYTTHNPDQDGTIRTITVDTGEGIGTDIYPVGSASAENRPPFANAGPDQSVDEGGLTTLDGINSADPDGDSLTWLWRQTGGSPVSFTATDPAPSFTAPAVGSEGETLTFTLTVTDPGGLSATDAVSITVRDIRQDLPAAAFTWSPEPQTVGLPVQFHDASTPGAASFPIASRIWDFGDGDSATLADPAHIYSEPGVYTVTLTVTDRAGAGHTARHMVTISTESGDPSDPSDPSAPSCEDGDCGGGSGGCFVRSLFKDFQKGGPR